MAAESWWVGKSRDEFSAAAPTEQRRMAYDGNRPILAGEQRSVLDEERQRRDHTGCAIRSSIWKRFLAWPFVDDERRQD